MYKLFSIPCILIIGCQFFTLPTDSPLDLGTTDMVNAAMPGRLCASTSNDQIQKVITHEDGSKSTIFELCANFQKNSITNISWLTGNSLCMNEQSNFPILNGSLDILKNCQLNIIFTKLPTNISSIKLQIWSSYIFPNYNISSPSLSQGVIGIHSVFNMNDNQSTLSTISGRSMLLYPSQTNQEYSDSDGDYNLTTVILGPGDLTALNILPKGNAEITLYAPAFETGNWWHLREVSLQAISDN